MRKLLFLLACFFMAGISLASAQSGTVSGKVISQEDGEPIIGATVLLKGTNSAVITDDNGVFNIALRDNAKILRISYVGMEVIEFQAVPNMLIKMKRDRTSLNEVIVTAMGISRKEKTLGYSATTVKGKDISDARNTNPIASLSGKVAGVSVSTPSSDPGSASSVVIRGFGSINGSNQPLYVVDGVPLQNFSTTTQGHAIAITGISNISANDIESMTILKGAAATALYGSRASGGVVLVTTKQGSAGSKRNFTLEYSGGMQASQVSYLPEMQNSFGQGWDGNQTYIENGSWGPRLDGSIQNYGPIWNNKDLNYQQLFKKYSALKNNVRDFFETGLSSNNSIALSGTSEDRRSTYYVSFSNDRNNGSMPSDADLYKRNTLAFHGGFDVIKWLKITPAINFSTSSTDVAGSFQGTSVVDGLYELPRDISLVDRKDLSSAFHTPESYFTPYGITNPYWALANNYNHTDAKKVYGKFQVDIKPIKEVTVTYRYGFDYYDFDNKIGAPEIALDDAAIIEDYGYAPSNTNAAGSVATSYSRAYETNQDVLVNYAKDFNKLSVNAFVGLNVNERYSTSISAQADGLSVYTGFWDLSNGSTWTTLSESQSKRRLVGLFGDITLGWADQYYLDLTSRNDWSSTLPIDNNSYFYPGVTGSWIFTKQIPDNKILSFGKLRFAYGQTGRDANVYQTGIRYVQASADGYYGTGIAQFPMNGSNSFLASTTLGSSTLSPEMTTEEEVGLNLQFLKGRIGLDAAFYHRVTDKQIFTLPVDPSTGYSAMVTNFGKVRNSGIELLLNAIPVQTNNFRWDLSVNFATNSNKVLSMPASLEGGKVIISRFSAGNDAVYMYAEAGKPMGEFYSYLSKKVEDKSSPDYGKTIVGSDGLPVVSTELVDTHKNMNNKWTGGITSSVSGDGFTLSASLDIRAGGHMFSRTKNLMMFTGNGVATTFNDRNPFVIPNSVQQVLDANKSVIPDVYQENSTPIYVSDDSYQKYLGGTNNKSGDGNTYYLIDRSYTKLRNVSLTWDVPKKWIGEFTGISVTAYANNLFVWTAADNRYVDPELSTGNGSNSATDLTGTFGEMYANPASRVYGCNFKVTF